MENKTFIDGSSPHIRGNSSTKRIMLDVIIALAAPFFAGLWFFGFRALLVVFLAVISAYASEVVFNLCCKKTFKQALDIDLTSIVTGFIIGLSLNANAAWYLPVMASVFAVIVVKMLCTLKTYFLDHCGKGLCRCTCRTSNKDLPQGAKKTTLRLDEV